jgi:hypothetical protein
MRKLLDRLLVLLRRTNASIRASLVEGSRNLDRRTP